MRSRNNRRSPWLRQAKARGPAGAGFSLAHDPCRSRFPSVSSGQRRNTTAPSQIPLSEIFHSQQLLSTLLIDCGVKRADLWRHLGAVCVCHFANSCTMDGGTKHGAGPAATPRAARSGYLTTSSRWPRCRSCVVFLSQPLIGLRSANPADCLAPLPARARAAPGLAHSFLK